MESELILSIGGLPPLSARGCVQELVPIQEGQWRRTLNGALMYLGSLAVKYRSIIHCRDKTVLATSGMSPGSIINVGCIQRLWHKMDGVKEVTLEREPVDGSVVALDDHQSFVKNIVVANKSVTFNEVDNVTFVTYRPWLLMCVKSFQLHTDEWGMTAGWRLELEEL